VRICVRGPRAEPRRPPYGASLIAPAGPSTRASPPRRSPKSSTPRVRLHLKPGQKGTKQLLAQYGDRLICVRYRYDAQRKKRFKTVELLVAERDWEPRRPRFAHDQIVELRVAFADVAVRDRVKQAGGTWKRQSGQRGASGIKIWYDACRSRAFATPAPPSPCGSEASAER